MCGHTDIRPACKVNKCQFYRYGPLQKKKQTVNFSICNTFLISYWACMSLHQVVLLSVTPAITTEGSPVSFTDSTVALPHKGAATYHGHVFLATSHHRQEPWPHRDPPTSVLTIPSTILPNYFFPSLLSCLTYCIHHFCFPYISFAPWEIFLLVLLMKWLNICTLMVWIHILWYRLMIKISSS